MAADPTAPQLLTGWGRTAPTAAMVVAVTEVDEVTKVLADPPARGVVARGLGRAYGDAAQNGGGVVLDLRGLGRIRQLDLEAGTASVDGGCSLDDLLRVIVPNGWFIGVSPGTRFVTVGGAIAADIHGKNHHLDGAFSNHVVDLDLQLADGEVRTLSATSPDPGDREAFWATCGGMGLTGVVLRATLRLLPIQTPLMRVDTERARDLDDCMARMEARDDEYRYSVAWLDSLATGASLGRAVLTRGDHALSADLPPGGRAARRRYDPRSRLAAPPWVPGGLLNRWSVAAFNEAWYRKAPRHEEGAIETIPAFFHPLDGIQGWNRIYGRRGFLQYQFVVPFGAEAALRRCAERLAAQGCASFLTVLKRFGAQGPGLISFPTPGWTLTLDIPAATPGLGPLLDGLDVVVLEAGGRLYLAKESRTRPELVPPMYPRLAEWRAVRDRLDPGRHFRSDLARRLDLLG